jgi:hypothetical protein
LRNVIVESGPIHNLGEEETLEEIAWALHTGRLHVCKGVIAGKQERGGAGAATAPPPNTGQQPPPPAAAPRQKTWVEFAVVDMEGNPVSGKKFRYPPVTPDAAACLGRLAKRDIVFIGRRSLPYQSPMLVP